MFMSGCRALTDVQADGVTCMMLFMFRNRLESEGCVFQRLENALANLVRVRIFYS